MFRFDKEQIVIEIAGVKMGGQPGEYPTVLCGTIFYADHNIINDELKGDFDKNAAEELINQMETMSDTTGNPCIIQTFGATPEAIVKYLEFVGEVSEKPFLIDSTSAEAKMEGAKYVDEIGLTDRAIYNSVNMSCEQDELDVLKNTDIRASIVLGFYPMESGVMGKLDIWDTGGSVMDKGILELAEDAGIDKFMMDVAITPLGQGAGYGLRTTFAEKAKWGYPVGSGIHNVPSAWDWLREFKKEGNYDTYHCCDIGASICQVIAGGDFVLFGPIENSKDCFPGIAMADGFISEAASEIGAEAIETHPINVVF